MANELTISVRDAQESDAAAIQSIYAPYVLGSLATFEEVPPGVDEMASRRSIAVRAGLPYLVAEAAGRVLGFSYATVYRPRPAYRYTVEDSVYVAEDSQGRGIGRSLLTALIERCEIGGWQQMIAVIGDSKNFASIQLHRRLGFQHVGTLKSVGFKLDQWVDTVLMQRALRHK